MYSKSVTEEILQCSCHCGILKVEQFYSDGYSILSYYPMAFNERQDGFFKRLWRKISMAASILMGKEYRLFEIVIDNNEDLNRFKYFVSQMRDIKNGDESD